MKKFRILFFSFLLFLSVLCVSHGVSVTEAAEYSDSCDAQITELKDDCTALESLYDAAGGDSWKNKTSWKSETTPLGQWFGVTVTDNRVSEISLGKNNLSGTVPDLGALTELQELLLYDNSLSGEIPDLSALAKLTQLHFNNNGLNGTITPSHLPASLGRLDLYNNRLSGTIPDLSGLKDIQVIHLGRNRLSGEIPDLSKLNNLEGLYLDGNSLSGTVTPSRLPASLKQLTLGLNSLSGEIPDLGTLTNLQWLFLFDNNLSGEIPDLSALAGLTRLRLNNNSLSGTITPSHLPASLELLYLSDNGLSGEIPDLSNLVKLTQLSLDNNSLSGTVPDLSALTSLYGLDLSANGLTGTIDASKLPASLILLNLRSNSLSGTIPDLSALTRLSRLNLSANALTGTINASKLPARPQSLSLHSNSLSGGIPDLSNINSLFYLILHNNALTGEIPVSNLPKNLSWLYLHNNKLTGSATALSPDLSKLARLKELSLWGNTDPAGTITLHGSVKMSVVDRAALKTLYYDNGGSGWSNRAGWLKSFLPLEQWHGVTTDAESGRVKALDLSGNGLENPVSNSLEALGSLAALNLSDNANLSGTLPVRLKDISGLLRLDIRCTDVSTPSSDEFNTWLNGLGNGFMKGCTPPPYALPFQHALPPLAPGAPELTAGNGQLGVSWTAPDDNGAEITDYDIRYQAGNLGKWIPHAHDGAATNATITGLENGMSYQVQVCATNSVGPGEWSPSATAAPTAPPSYECPEFEPGVTAEDVVDRDTLRGFVKGAIASIKKEVAKAEQDDVPDLIRCYSKQGGPWKHGAVHLFLIEASTVQVVLDGIYPEELEGREFIARDKGTINVKEEIIKVAGEEGTGDFIAYYWKDPLPGNKNANPNSNRLEDGESSGTSYKVIYVEGFTLENYEPGEVLIMGSGIYLPEPAEPEEGGCAISGGANTSQGAVFSLLIILAACGTVLLRNGDGNTPCSSRPDRHSGEKTYSNR